MVTTSGIGTQDPIPAGAHVMRSALVDSYPSRTTVRDGIQVN